MRHATVIVIKGEELRSKCMAGGLVKSSCYGLAGRRALLSIRLAYVPTEREESEQTKYARQYTCGLAVEERL